MSSRSVVDDDAMWVPPRDSFVSPALRRGWVRVTQNPPDGRADGDVERAAERVAKKLRNE